MGFYICNVCCVNVEVLVEESGLSNGILFIEIILVTEEKRALLYSCLNF